MKEHELRSDCPINFALELFGDKWSLLILRDMLFAGKRSYNQFLESKEKIATNILANRLKLLEERGFIEKRRDLDNRTKYVYSPAPMALDLLPTLVEVMVWGADYYQDIPDLPDMIVRKAKHNRKQLLKELRVHAQTGSTPEVLLRHYQNS